MADLESRLGTAPPELLEALVASVADAIYLVDAEGRVRFVNPAGLALLGYESEDDLLGRPSHATIHGIRPDGSPYPEAECPLLRPRRTGEAVRVEDDWFVRRDGTLIPVAYSSAPVETEGGRGAVVVFRDMSERHQAEAVRSSRRRILGAADAERRRLGRDLHDGAQQRLVQVGLVTQMARAKLDSDPAAVGDLLDEALAETRAAIDDVRAISAGLHPPILTSRGLAVAIDSLAGRAPVPVAVDVTTERFDPELEATAYYVVAEALTNLAKHAGARSAAVRVQVSGDRLEIAVSDDGRGGADPGGSGLHGLLDRVSALNGTLRIVSPAGGGTELRAELPL